MRSSAVVQLHRFGRLASTNDWLLQRLRDGYSIHRHLCVCDEQTQGRGQRKRHWYGRKGSSLAFSFGYEHPRLMPTLTLVCGLAAAKTLNAFFGAHLKLKWPNDVYATHGKIGGILVDVEQSRGLSRYVIGMGLNLRRDACSDPCIAASSLETEGIICDDEHALIMQLVSSWHDHLQRLFCCGFTPFKPCWSQLDWLCGKKVRFEDHGIQTEAICQGIASDGGYRVTLANGSKRVLYSAQNRLTVL